MISKCIRDDMQDYTEEMTIKLSFRNDITLHLKPQIGISIKLNMKCFGKKIKEPAKSSSTQR